MLIEDTYNGGVSYASSDFSGAAQIYLKRADYSNLSSLSTVIDYNTISAALDSSGMTLDLVIQDVGFSYADRSQISAHMGDNMSVHFYGKKATVLNVKARLFETDEGDSRHQLMTLYRDLFRATAVAKHRLVPILEFVGFTVPGVFLTLDFNDSANIGDGVDITFTFLAFNIYQKSSSNLSGIANTDVLYNEQSNFKDKRCSDPLVTAVNYNSLTPGSNPNVFAEEMVG